MTLTETITLAKTETSAAITSHLAALRPTVTATGPMAGDAMDRLSAFALRGKFLRAALVFLGTQLGPNPVDVRTATAVAATMELTQSGLLIHDDVMDRDETRRGSPSVHAQYRDIARRRGSADPTHVAEAMAVAVGDLAFFAANGLLAKLNLDASLKERILTLYSTELSAVCAAQLGDVAFGASPMPVNERDILTVYRFKTGRYTCSLPLMLGAIAAGANDTTLEKLLRLGEAAGTLFQLADDRLGLFGDSAQTGKPIGSDIREGKWTPYRIRLMDRATGDTRTRLAMLFGNPALTDEDVGFVRETVRSLGIEIGINTLAEGYATTAGEIIDHIPAPADWKTAMHGLIVLITERNT